MNLSREKAIYSLPIICIALLAIIINTTDPSVNVASILLVFLLLYVLLVSAIYIVLRLFRHWMSLVNHKNMPVRSKMSQRRAYYIASALAFIPVCLLALQSLNQVRWLDLVLVLLLSSLVVFYIFKRTS